MLKERKLWGSGNNDRVSYYDSHTGICKISLSEGCRGCSLDFHHHRAVIVLLQLVPAAILFFSFVGTSSNMVFKRKKEVEKAAAEEKALVTGVEPAPVKR